MDEDMLPVTLSGVSTIFPICLSSFATILIFLFLIFFFKGNEQVGDYIISSDRIFILFFLPCR